PLSLAPAGSFPIVSFLDVVNGTLDPGMVRDRLVVLGLTIQGLDEFATPTTAERRMWGAEILGHTMETILRDRYLLPASSPVTGACIGILAVLASLMVAAVRPLLAGLSVLGLLAGYLFVGVIAFDQGTILNLVYPPLAAALTAGATLLYRLRSGEAQE